MIIIQCSSVRILTVRLKCEGNIVRSSYLLSLKLGGCECDGQGGSGWWLVGLRL